MCKLDGRATARLPQLVAALLGAVLVAAMFVLASPAPASAADGGAEAQFVARINSLRASKGVAPLAVFGELQGIARNWSDQMVSDAGISHNPSYSSQVSADWRKLGENVGVGSDVDVLMKAFINSPAHYKNLVDPEYNYVGVGVSYDATGRMFTTHDFMRMDDASAPSYPDPAPAPAPAPRKQSAPVDAAPAPTQSAPAESAPVEPPAPPTAPATSTRVRTVLTALRVNGN
ncbi:MAG: hypothetical protein QOC92_1975 [Acidimicrobiaceae bacterium]|jgi:uncharacterized protein YkwD